MTDEKVVLTPLEELEGRIEKVELWGKLQSERVDYLEDQVTEIVQALCVAFLNLKTGLPARPASTGRVAARNTMKSVKDPARRN